MTKHTEKCPCCSNKAYQDCCKPLHMGTTAQTPESLMRSRYAAYTMGLEEYLLHTWHESTRPLSLNLAEDVKTKWLGLEVKHTERIDDVTATVEFIARFKTGGERAQRLHEISQFKRSDRWYYLSGLHI